MQGQCNEKGCLTSLICIVFSRLVTLVTLPNLTNFAILETLVLSQAGIAQKVVRTLAARHTSPNQPVERWQSAGRSREVERKSQLPASVSREASTHMYV